MNQTNDEKMRTKFNVPMAQPKRTLRRQLINNLFDILAIAASKKKLSELNREWKAQKNPFAFSLSDLCVALFSCQTFSTRFLLWWYNDSVSLSSWYSSNVDARVVRWTHSNSDGQFNEKSSYRWKFSFQFIIVEIWVVRPFDCGRLGSQVSLRRRRTDYLKSIIQTLLLFGLGVAICFFITEVGKRKKSIEQNKNNSFRCWWNILFRHYWPFTSVLFDYV